MKIPRNFAGPVALALLLGLGQAAPPTDTTADSSTVTPQIVPSSIRIADDTPPGGAAKPAGPATARGVKLSKLEYEGWRQYSANCARCHGQDVLPNPVAANLLISLGPGGPIDSEQKFAEIVMAGRPASGMPAFKNILTPSQIKAIYAYVKGRAEKRIPPGRPAKPA